VRGRAYKAHFGSDGATIIPYFGSAAPRNYPIRFSLAAAASGGARVELVQAGPAVLTSNRITIDRGVIDEVYDLGLDRVEQSFVIEARPLADELDLFVDISVDFVLTPHAGGVDLKCDSGSVHYGQAFAVSADGSKLPLATEVVDGRIRIHLDAGALAQAEFPLVVDPLISVYTLDDSTLDNVEPDLSYDATTDRYLIAYEENFSATDGDIYAQLRASNGTIQASGYLDFTTENWRSPQTANLNAYDQFLCVAQTNNVVGSTGWVVRGRTVAAGTFALGSRFNISTTDQSGDKILPDIGGDPNNSTPSYYCVTWHRTLSASETDIHARLVTSSSTLLGPGTILVDNSTGSMDTWPSIAKSNGASAWTIAWFRYTTATTTEIHAARLSSVGTIVDPSTSLVAALGVDYYPRVSSPTDDGRVLIVYAHDYISHHDLHYLLLNGVSIESSGNLTSLELPTTQLEDQVEYSVDSDGERFVVAFAESRLGSAVDYNVFASAFARLGGSLVATEAHMLLSGIYTSAHTDIVAKHSGGIVSREYAMVWDRKGTPADRDIHGADFLRPLGGGSTALCAGDGSGPACPCGNNGNPGRGCRNSTQLGGALLTSLGLAQPGANDTQLFTANNLPPFAPSLLFQGTTGGVGFAFGDGLLCVGGSILRFGVKFADANGFAAWPSGADPSISVSAAIPLSGAQHIYQAYYRDAANYCTSATFNLTNGQRVVWLP
jgi:hypothetical protein